MPRKATKRRESFGALRKLPSGRYQASYVTPEGARQTAPSTFDTMGDARGWLAIQQGRMVTGEWEPPRADAAAARRQTFREYADMWLSTRTGRDGVPLRDRTRVEYIRLLDGPLADLGQIPVTSITPAVVRGWYAAQVKTGKHTQAARAYGVLRTILATCVTDGLLTTNPASIRGAQSASTGKKVEPPTIDELAIIVATIDRRYVAAVLLAAWGGFRYGEVTELRRRDILAGEGELLVAVSRGVNHVPGIGFTVGPPKTAAGVRTVAMPPHTHAAILEHLERVGHSPDALLFPASDGITHLAASTLAKHWYPARRAAGREDLPFHGLRHFGATRYAVAGATIRELQHRLGHTTAAAAMRYQHVAGRDSDLARRMSESL